MAGRKIRDEGDARRCMTAVKASGLSRSEWARQRGIDGRSLFAWVKKLERGEKRRIPQMPEPKRKKRRGMVELIADRASAERRYLIRCGQFSVEVDDHFDEATVVRLLKVLAAC